MAIVRVLDGDLRSSLSSSSIHSQLGSDLVRRKAANHDFNSSIDKLGSCVCARASQCIILHEYEWPALIGALIVTFSSFISSLQGIRGVFQPSAKTLASGWVVQGSFFVAV